MKKNSELIILAGPTGSGKTEIVCNLNKDLFEVVSFDSRQVYQEMEIGTAAPSRQEKSRIKHHLVDIIKPNEKLNAASFAKMAKTIIDAIYQNGKIPIIVCGTGFYLKAFLYGMYPVPEITSETQEKINSITKEERSELLLKLDPDAMKNLFIGDDYRISRALAVTLSGSKWSSLKESPTLGYLHSRNFNITGILLAMNRKILYNRLNIRAKKMLSSGLIEETKMIAENYGENCHGLKTIGYNFALEIIAGKISLETGYSSLAQSHRNYAKKQITWFKKDTLLIENSPETAMIHLKKIEKRFKDVS